MDDSEQLSVLAELESLLSRRPFVPYAIVMNSGREYVVGENDTVSIGRSIVFVIPAAGGQRLLRHSQICELIVEEPTP